MSTTNRTKHGLPCVRHKLSTAVLAAALSCAAMSAQTPAGIMQTSDSIKSVYAPDSRTAVYAPDFTIADNEVFLRGETSSAQAKTALLSALQGQGYTVHDHMRILPDTAALGNGTYAIVNLSVCNMRTKPDFSAEMTTQALMGMPVRVLERSGTWYRIQTPDNYIAWVHPAGICRMTKAEYDDWNSSEQIVVTQHFGCVFSQADKTSQVVSDIVAGDRLKLAGRKGKYYEVEYPDGRKGFVGKDVASPLDEWRKANKTNAEAIISTAFSMTGFPYLWAGTSSKGVDCSGFVRTILYMHDIIIPRDASQMAYTGQRIDIASDFGNLSAGDLIFFGTKATDGKQERISHVGIYIGGKRFIHSQGYVHVSSLSPDDELFDEFNLNRMLHAVRFLPLVNKDADFTTTDKNPYYNH